MTHKQILSSPDAPQAIGPYSQGIATGQFIFLAGQLPLDPSTAIIVAGEIKEQTTQVLKNIKALLCDNGSSLDQVVNVTVFLKNMNDFAGMNEVYASFFTNNYPARSTVQVARLPKDALVEIAVIALKGK